MQRKANGGIERRKGPDFLVRLIGWSKLMAWVMAMCILILVSYAKPELETFFDRMFDIHVRKSWDYELTKKAIYMAILLFFVCSCALLVNSTRRRRKEDRYSISLVLLGIISFITVTIYCINVM
jgi:hypothetical protein